SSSSLMNSTDTNVRAFAMDDWRDVAELFLAPKCCWGTLQLPYQSMDDIKAKLESPPAGMHRLVAEREGKVLGMLGMHTFKGRRAHVSDIGMFVHDDAQGQGLGTSLLAAAIDLSENWLNLHRMELTVYPDNAAAIGLYEKHAFQREGTLVDYAYRDGKYGDALCMARLRGR
ncbi:MAG: putative acetyltransferase, partial [Planctomycetota bacterium]